MTQVTGQPFEEEYIEEPELYNKFFHVMSEPFSLYFSYSQGTDNNGFVTDVT